MKSTIKKLFIGSASSILLMATLPIIQSHDVLPYSITQQISVEASNRASLFLMQARHAPSLATIQNLPTDTYGLFELQSIKSEIHYTRSIYQELSRSEKNNSEVKRWEGYLTVKEEAIGTHFIQAVSSLPTVSQLRGLSENQTQAVAREITAIRKAFSQLPNITKMDSDVQRWEGYLNSKEKIVDPATYFVKEAQSLPNISSIQTMTGADFQQAKLDIQVVRQAYQQLPSKVKTDPNVIRWEGFLAEKEATLGLNFIRLVMNLPTLSVIEQMTDNEADSLENDIQELWTAYNLLSNGAKTDADVDRWAGYLTQKEEAIAFRDPLIQARMTQIKKRWSELKPVLDTVVYAKNPSTTPPYVPGLLSDQSLNDALNATNFVRFVTGLPDNIQLNKTYSQEAQAASLVNAVNNLMTHYPEQPQDMNRELYELGYKGASTSNIGRGYLSVSNSILSGYMYDGHESNIRSVGHRLWTLSPKLKEVGFGYVNGHTAMKVVEDNMYSNDTASYDFISWPAETAMPLRIRQSYHKLWGEGYPWSISLNSDKYDNTKLENIEVRLTRLKDEKVWRFSPNAADGFFNISTDSIGYLPYTIIFRPDGLTYKPGDRFQVEIKGVQTLDGVEEFVQFETTFFDL